ncbi:MAG: hypothetical protein ACRDRI_10670 [Pseudonocardiaceae bacterium]
MTALSDVILIQVLVDAGFRDDGTLRYALAVVFVESGAHCDAKNTVGNDPPSTDRGLLQINSFWHHEVTDTCAYDCLCNAKAAYHISNGGTN